MNDAHAIMAQSLTLKSGAFPAVAIRTALASDCENLRVWKNANRTSFFHQETITPEAQRRWFEAYMERADDWMFVVLAGGEAIGCMGFRLRDGEADVYNVILGRPEHGGRGVMAAAMQLMCSYINTQSNCAVVASVLKKNPAVAWYEKQGFSIAVEEDSHYLMKLDTTGRSPVAFTQIEA